jgi:hypothetical protein
MKPCRLIFILFTLFSPEIFSQGRYLPGAIVLADGDTVRGFVLPGQGNTAHQVCWFKAQGKEKGTSYLPGQLKSFRIDGGAYFESGELPGNEGNPVFLKVLVDGYPALLKHQQDYYFRRDSVLTLLITREKTAEVDGRTVKLPANYIRVLNFELSDCPELRADIDRLTATERALTELFRKYNICTNRSWKIYEEDVPWVELDWGAGIGTYISGIVFETTNDAVLENGLEAADFAPSFGPMAGINLDLRLPRTSRSLSLSTGLYYTQQNWSASSQVPGNLGRVYYIDSRVSVSSLYFPLALKYRLPYRTFAPAVKAGISAAFFLTKSDEYDILEVMDDRQWNRQESDYIEFASRQLGLFGSLCLEDMRIAGQTFSLEAGIEKGSGIVRNIIGQYVWGSHTTNAILRLNYHVRSRKQ